VYQLRSLENLKEWTQCNVN